MAKEKDFLQDVADQFGDDVIVGREPAVREWISTGSYALNRIISGDYLKGYPYGKIVELFGDPSTGKSFFILAAFAEHQKKHGKKAACVFDDTEDSCTDDVAIMNGVDVVRLIRKKSYTVEEHFGKMFGLKLEVEKKSKAEDDEERPKKMPGLLPYILGQDPEARFILALDSVAMLSTEHEMEAGFSKDDMTKAKKLRAGIRQSWPFISKQDVLYLISNHVIADIANAGYGNPRTTPGGKAIPFLSTVRVELTIREKLKKGDRITGVLTEAFIRKNKVAPPFRRAKIRIDFQAGIDKMSGLADLLIEDGIVDKKAQGILYFGKEKVPEREFTEEMFLALLKTHKEEKK